MARECADSASLQIGMRILVTTETLAKHILAVYDAMDKEAVDLDGNRIFIGSLSTLVRAIASSTYYAPITRTLYDGGYVALVDRGGRSKPSTLLLLRRPREDELRALTFEAEAPILSLINRIESIEASLGGTNVIKEFSEVKGKLRMIEERLEQDGKATRKSKARSTNK
jgi:hypothetical protein